MTAETLTGVRLAVARAGSQADLGDAEGVTQQAVGEWVRRGYVPAARVASISKRYNIPRDELLNPEYLQILKGGKK